MALSGTHKERTRNRILDEAAGAMRERGHEGIGVAELMKRAGLTHGGFYAHFTSRDDLVAHAVDRMFEDSKAMVARFGDANDPAASLSGLIDYYLSDSHRKAVASGCAVAALGSEAGRMPAQARDRFEQGVASFRLAVARLVAMIGVPDADVVASSVVNELVGALMLSRASRDEADACRLLEASRVQLKHRLGLPV